MPPMPERVAAIKRGIETRGDFTGLAHGGEAALFAWAKANGLRGPSLVLEWQANYNRAHGGGARPTAPRSARPAQIATDLRSSDLDYWADDEPDDGDGDDLPPGEDEADTEDDEEDETDEQTEDD